MRRIRGWHLQLITLLISISSIKLLRLWDSYKLYSRQFERYQTITYYPELFWVVCTLQITRFSSLVCYVFTECDAEVDDRNRPRQLTTAGRGRGRKTHSPHSTSQGSDSSSSSPAHRHRRGSGPDDRRPGSPAQRYPILILDMVFQPLSL